VLIVDASLRVRPTPMRALWVDQVTFHVHCPADPQTVINVNIKTHLPTFYSAILSKHFCSFTQSVATI